MALPAQYGLFCSRFSPGKKGEVYDIVKKPTQEREGKKHLKEKVGGESLLALCDENENNWRNKLSCETEDIHKGRGSLGVSNRFNFDLKSHRQIPKQVDAFQISRQIFGESRQIVYSHPTIEIEKKREI